MSNLRQEKPEEGLIGRSYGLVLSPGAPWTNPAYGWDQILTAASGTFQVASNGSIWRIGSGTALFIPSGTSHSITAVTRCDLRALFIRKGDFPSFQLVSITPLLKEVLLSASQLGALFNSRDRDRALLTLTLSEMASCSALPLRLPWPKDMSMIRVAETLLSGHTTNESASKIGMSRKTLERRFQIEMGFGPGAWLREYRLIRAAHSIMAGISIGQAAFDAGYGTASAFTYSFRQRFGSTPSQFRSAHSS